MSTTPQMFTITQTGTYRTSDGKQSFYLIEGTKIPMQLAIAMGIEGAEYVDPPVFDQSQRSAIEAEILAELADTESDIYQAIAAIGGGGGGGGGATFPMAEGVWYSPYTAIGGQSLPPSSNELTTAADTAFAALIYVYESCTISKVGIWPGVPAADATLRFSLHTPATSGWVGAKVADLGEVVVAATYDEMAAVEDSCSVAVTPGWYYAVIASNVEITLSTIYGGSNGSGFSGPLPGNSDGDGVPRTGVRITSAGIESAIPADLTSATQTSRATAPTILFQITHD